MQFDDQGGGEDLTRLLLASLSHACLQFHRQALLVAGGRRACMPRWQRPSSQKPLMKQYSLRYILPCRHLSSVSPDAASSVLPKWP
jgi:hypothetical protein